MIGREPAGSPVASRIAYSLRVITERFGGDIEGDADTMVDCVGTLESAGASAITFLMQDRFVSALRGTRAGAVIVSAANRNGTTRPRIICNNPYAYFARVSALLNPGTRVPAGVHPTAVIDATACLGADVSVDAHAVIGAGAKIADEVQIGAHAYVGHGVSIGPGSRLAPNTVVCHDCRVGARVILHPGVVIGADGFGNAFDEGRWLKVPQVGRVIIGDDVEIGANTTVDRGAIEDTVIEAGVRLDNLIMVAHNVHIGAHTAIAACTGIAGSTRIGRYCRIGGAVGIAGHLTIADQVEIAGKTLVTKSIPRAGSYSGGYPFEETTRWRRNAVRIRQLDAMAKQLKALERRLEQYEKTNEGKTP